MPPPPTNLPSLFIATHPFVSGHLTRLYRYTYFVISTTVNKQLKASGGLLQISEMQSRWFCEHIVGNLQLPSIEQMKDIAKEQFDTQQSSYSGSDRHTIQTDPLLYW